MGLRFQRVLRIIPGLRINLSKSGVSGSVGPRGASVNVGRHGITTSAGIPGTGLSYRQRLGHPGTLLGVVLLIAALAFSAWKGGTFNSVLPPQVQHATSSSSQGNQVEAAATAASGTRTVSRNNAVLHATPSAHGTTLKHESKGTEVSVIATSGDWIEVRDGDTTGWMKAGTLKDTPPK